MQPTSPDFNQLLSAVQTLVVLIMLGSVLKSFKIIPAEFAPMINRVVLTVCLPALVFRAVRSTQIQTFRLEWLIIPVVAILVILGCGVLGYGVAKFLRLDRKRTGVFLLAVMFGSTAFVGYPLFEVLAIRSDLGQDAMFHHVFFSELGTLVPLVTLGLVIASHYGEGRPWQWSELLAVPRSAPFIAMLLGLLFYNDNLPPIVDSTVDVLADSTSFLMMFSLGLTISWGDLARFWPANLGAVGVRLIAAPVMAFFLATTLQTVLPLSDIMVRVLVIDAAMPAILLCLVYAGQFKLDVKFASAVVFTNFLFALPTLFVVLVLTTSTR